MYKERQKHLVKALEEIDANKLLVHSDSLRTMSLIKVTPNKNCILEEHIKLLKSLVKDDGLILPTFNYNFPKNRVFDLNKTQSEVGHISEFYRSNFSTWRTLDPMFSVCGTGDNPIKNTGVVCSFDDDSIFSDLVKDNGHVLFYGASLKTATIIHYAEFLSNVTYRYWKEFDGELVVNDQVRKLKFNSHFRPMGKHLDYNWTKIKLDLQAEGILKFYNRSVMGFDAKILIDFWCSKLLDDHFYFLDDISRAWVEPMLHILGRPFVVTDFEVQE